MSLVWSPEPSEQLYVGSEILQEPLTFEISASIVEESEEGESTSTPVTITQISIEPSIEDIEYIGIGTTSLHLTVNGFGVLYPIEIRTVDFDTQKITSKTDFSVPQGSKIFYYSKDPTSPKTLTITVYAGSDSAEYTMIVNADYSSNLPAFLQAVQNSY